MMNTTGYGRQVVACFKGLSRHLTGGTKVNHEKSQDSRSRGRDLNLGPPEYETGVLIIQPRGSAR
jgi:hypothetical protein